jgi:hypothetical protein
VADPNYSMYEFAKFMVYFLEIHKNGGGQREILILFNFSSQRYGLEMVG